jgi:hypothetical protein
LLIAVDDRPATSLTPSRTTPPNGSDQGTRVPRSRCHKSMILMRDGGPARTRTWDQGIMSHRISSQWREKAEEVQALFRWPLCLPIPTEHRARTLPNPLPKVALSSLKF